MTFTFFNRSQFYCNITEFLRKGHQRNRDSPKIPPHTYSSEHLRTSIDNWRTHNIYCSLVHSFYWLECTHDVRNIKQCIWGQRGVSVMSYEVHTTGNGKPRKLLIIQPYPLYIKQRFTSVNMYGLVPAPQNSNLRCLICDVDVYQFLKATSGF